MHGENSSPYIGYIIPEEREKWENPEVDLKAVLFNSEHRNLRVAPNLETGTREKLRNVVRLVRVERGTWNVKN
jgi:hypothetical protein